MSESTARPLPPRSALPAAELRERAQAGLKAKREAGAHYRRDYLDSDLWDELARARGLRLPQWHRAPTPGYMASWLKKLDIPVASYLDYAAEPNLAAFAKRNPSCCWVCPACVPGWREGRALADLEG